MPIRASGFTFLRNAVKLDYPADESIRSVLPIVDDFIVNIGLSEDGTEEFIISPGKHGSSKKSAIDGLLAKVINLSVYE